jgi:hypothetical protein
MSSRVLCSSLACLLALALTGCTGSTPATPSTEAPSISAGLAIQGSVHGGQQPIALAHVYLFAANTTGYGGPGIAPSASNASVSLLNATSTGYSDSIGAYVLTDGNGNFSITGDYSCTPNTQVYLYALGGNPGLTSGTNNTAAGLLAALGNCPAAGNFLTATPYVVVNEVSTVAAAYALAGFASDATHVSSSGTALAQTGIANAFANAANLETLSTGAALATTPAGNGAVPQSTINTLANILAACINTNGAVTGPTSPTPCYTLFNNALSGGSSGTVPSDTAAAAINIAHNPSLNISALFALPTAQSPFAPGLAAQPNDFTVAIQFTGGPSTYPGAIAIDGSGNVWITNNEIDVGDQYGAPGMSVTKLSSLGAVLSGANGYTGGVLGEIIGPLGIAIDLEGNAWIADGVGANAVSKLSNSGSFLLPYGVIEGGGLNSPSGVAIDGSGNAWITNFLGNSVTELSSSGSFLSGTNGFTGGGLINPTEIAIDGSGNAWVSNIGNSGVTKVSSSGEAIYYAGGEIYAASGYYIAVDRSGSAWATGIQGGSVSKFSNSGALISPSNGYTGGGLNWPAGIAIDGSGNAWVANSVGNSITELSSSGSVLSGANGYLGPGITGPYVIAVDGSGNVWVAMHAPGSSGATEFIGTAAPVITPICAGLPATPTADGTSKLGTRP